MRKPASLALGAVLLAAASQVVLAQIAGAGPTRPTAPPAFDARTYLREHGYLPLRGVETLRKAKAHAAAVAASMHAAGSSPVRGSSSTDPSIRKKFEGIYYTPVSPSDSNGAAGPQSYIEIVNVQIAVYKRDGTRLLSAPLSSLTGHGGLSDPMILWDPDTQRFFYSVLNVPASTMDWGFSKDDNPTSVPASFCNYETDFGYPRGSIPDYPKLGQSKEFLMIGINYYPAPFFDHATQSDVMWIGKPQGREPITRCPKAGSFKSGKFEDLRNEDGSQAFTPVPAIQTDQSSAGAVMAMSDIECPPICGKGTLLTQWIVKPDPGDPKVASISDPRSITVGKYESPPDAPQKGTDNLLDTLDGRLTHAVSGFDPSAGHIAVWLSHAVLGGGGSEVRWYEVVAGPSPRVLRSGAASDPNLYAFNGGISTDRTVHAGGRAAHGEAMVLGFNTSSSNAYPAIQMVSQVRDKQQSAFVVVEQTATFHDDFSCTPVCRWGDYSGATPDPAMRIRSLSGEVWLTCQLTSGTHWTTWNWKAKP